MMEAKKKYEKPAFRLVTDLGSILECLYEVYGTDGTMLIAGNKLSGPTYSGESFSSTDSNNSSGNCMCSTHWNFQELRKI